ncbi:MULTISPECIES: prenyltransferase [unclassified Aeromicrobium]|uniref:prenyltransferase n=1 Tax=unclassified Aeromicrobium TaxID=2633570 RepID=UPI00288BD941|nr:MULTISPECIES: prenyltransferase [unclassified Aeromicrobium]
MTPAVTGSPAVLALPGVLDAAQVQATADTIAAVQTSDGAIPWEADGHLDPWDHLQAAMGLAVAGRREEAEAAYAWSRSQQRPDGTWATKYAGGEVVEPATDANFTAYVATAVWHHWRLTGDRAFVSSMWPSVQGALDAVLVLQDDAGPVRWSRGADGCVADEALVTGNASIHLSLRCGVALADVVGERVPRWEDAAVRLRHALDHHPDRFADKARFSMDWYYPVLGGALPRAVALARLERRWDDFVVPGFGARCVDDSPWVTGGETCELVLALDAVGRGADARALLADIQVLRREDATYWTGYVYPDETYWPIEQTTWTAGTVLLAVDALTRTTPANGLFRGEGLPLLAADGECDQPCVA